MFDLTTGQWLFCSIFAGVCTVIYMIHLFQVDEENRIREEQEMIENDFTSFLDFLERMCNDEVQEEIKEEETKEEKEGEKEENED